MIIVHTMLRNQRYDKYEAGILIFRTCFIHISIIDTHALGAIRLFYKYMIY
jgi:hypothetical protein